MNKKRKCESCGEEVYTLIFRDGKWICESCAGPYADTREW